MGWAFSALSAVRYFSIPRNFVNTPDCWGSKNVCVEHFVLVLFQVFCAMSQALVIVFIAVLSFAEAQTTLAEEEETG